MPLTGISPVSQYAPPSASVPKELWKKYNIEHIEDYEKKPDWQPAGARFYNIGSNPDSQVVPDKIHANYLMREERPYCIATQFPTTGTLQIF
ncbi:hypothetical protein [Glaciimonas immobilis]|uniref:Uncharacterized protein n=1 Tax=Glaciimonas immobilis TaxID=728004 RepID=A0A840RRD8_9BURK|nr:hypothetical protein [Glaciimonas immobilis]KAF3999855.1 hypothetical protein HAV38_01310 [Glaciimonas immobilis]MBB5200335.1 hypothetical protein [Glaciimonas immobilis]